MKYLYTEKANGIACIHFEDANGKEHILTCSLFELLNDMGIKAD